ncbi:hypothetical protein GJ496_003673 [Pomphorhynchus laevis]|nr:hypothetical protein GJ496_003673 [Pomphorhynchus laevis]
MDSWIDNEEIDTYFVGTNYISAEEQKVCEMENINKILMNTAALNTFHNGYYSNAINSHFLNFSKQMQELKGENRFTQTQAKLKFDVSVQTITKINKIDHSNKIVEFSIEMSSLKDKFNDITRVANELICQKNAYDVIICKLLSTLERKISVNSRFVQTSHYNVKQTKNKGCQSEYSTRSYISDAKFKNTNCYEGYSESESDSSEDDLSFSLATKAYLDKFNLGITDKIKNTNLHARKSKNRIKDNQCCQGEYKTRPLIGEIKFKNTNCHVESINAIDCSENETSLEDLSVSKSTKEYLNKFNLGITEKNKNKKSRNWI